MCTCAQDAKSAAVILRGRRSVTNEKIGGFHRLQVGSIFFLILRFAQISFGLLPGNGFTPLSKFHRIEKRELLVCKALRAYAALATCVYPPFLMILIKPAICL
jgi:hypothetical protein